MGARETIAMMALTMALQALAVDAMLPALGDIATDLSVPDANQRQLVVGVFLLASGFASLLPGSLADRYGRRPILLGCIGLYVLFSLGCGLAVLAISGQAVNLFSLLALVLVLGIGINYTLFFSNPRGTPLTSLLAITLAMLTTLLTLGMLVFSATQAISSFGIVLVSGIFTAFLLSPLAMPDKKRTKK